MMRRLWAIFSASTRFISADDAEIRGVKLRTGQAQADVIRVCASEVVGQFDPSLEAT